MPGVVCGKLYTMRLVNSPNTTVIGLRVVPHLVCGVRGSFVSCSFLKVLPCSVISRCCQSVGKSKTSNNGEM